MEITGLNQDSLPQHYSKNDYYYAKNILLKGRLVTNERGTLKRVDTKEEIIGIIPIEEDFIIFSGRTPDINGNYAISNISYYKDDQFLPIQNLFAVSPLLNFNRNFPIHGVYYKNFKQEILIAWTDNLNTPKILNIGTSNTLTIRNVTNINDIQLFPDTNLTNIKVNTIGGGTMLTGSYFITYAYKDADNTVTNFHQLSVPAWVVEKSSGIYDGLSGSPSNLVSDKQLRLELDNVDTRFDYIVIGTIQVVNGVTSAKVWKDVPITSNKMTVYVTGNEKYSDSTLEEFLIPAIKYNKIKTLTEHNDRLYGGNVAVVAEENYQLVSNNIRLKYVTEYHAGKTDVSKSHKTTNPKGFCHGEVYAFYVRYLKQNGTFTKAYHIPNRPASLSDTALVSGFNSTYGIAESLSTAKSFQVNDTCTKVDVNSGDLGYWENETENYPSTPDYPVGKVRHFRFPSIRYMKENFYNAVGNYGTQVLDTLGVRAENVILPTGIIGYEILYAERDYQNSLVITTDIMQFASRMLPINSNEEEGVNTNGGNWHLESVTTEIDYVASMPLGNKYLRLHAFDLMLNKPSLSNAYFNVQLKLVKPNLNTVYGSAGYAGGKSLEGGFLQRMDKERPWLAQVVDFTSDNTVVTVPALQYGGLEISYLPNNVRDKNIFNVYAEACALAKLTKPVGFYGINPNLLFSSTNVQGRPSNDRNLMNGDEEHTNLITIQQFLVNVHAPFYRQKIVTTGQINRTIVSETIFGGDVFVGCNSWVATAPTDGNNVLGVPEDNSRGLFFFKRHLSEGVNNVGLRYITAKKEDYLYPFISPNVFIPDPETIEMDYTKDYNNWTLYDKSYTVSNNLQSIVINNPFVEDLYEFQYRVIRSKKLNREEQTVSWKSWLPNDYYEMPKNRGYITNVEGFGEKLIIHHQFGLFLTRDKTVLATNSDILKVTLGSGDIFDIDPFEVLPKSGHCGTHHQLSAIVTKIGYFFVECMKGRVFLLNDSLEEISSNDMKGFFATNLPLRTTELVREKTPVPFTSICINNKLVLIIQKHKDHADLIPLDNTAYTIEYDLINGAGTTSGVIVPLATDTQAGVLVRRSHYWLYTTTNYVRPLEGYIYMNSIVKKQSIDITDNPYIGKGYTSIFDEKNNRLILCKNNQGNITIFGRFKGILSQLSLLDEWEDDDLVMELQAGVLTYHKLRLEGNQANSRVYIARNPITGE